MIKLSLACFVLFFGSLVIADNVPAIIWGPFNHYTPAIALKSYNADEFINILSEHITPDTFTVIVTEDQLSNEDLSQCRTSDSKTCYQGIQQIKNKLYLTSVEDPISILEDVAGTDKAEVSLLSNGGLSEPLNPEGGKYVFVNFEDGTSDETKSSKIIRHDQLVTALYKELSSQDLHLVVIYTGKRAEHQKRVVRQVAASSTTTGSSTTTTASTPSTPSAATSTVQQKQDSSAGIFWQRDRLLLYYHILESVDANGVATEIIIDNVTVSETGTKLDVVLSAASATFEFNITGEAGYWWIDQISYNDQLLSSDTRISAIDNFSFHCTPSITLVSSNRNTVLRWRGLQLQPEFGTVAGQVFNSFGDPWDCVGFVSPGIVGGLFVVIMLLFILSIGISWMMDINTMDRFDDPKGKTITINVNE